MQSDVHWALIDSACKTVAGILWFDVRPLNVEAEYQKDEDRSQSVLRLLKYLKYSS